MQGTIKNENIKYEGSPIHVLHIDKAKIVVTRPSSPSLVNIEWSLNSCT